MPLILWSNHLKVFRSNGHVIIFWCSLILMQFFLKAWTFKSNRDIWKKGIMFFYKHLTAHICHKDIDAFLHIVLSLKKQSILIKFNSYSFRTSTHAHESLWCCIGSALQGAHSESSQPKCIFLNYIY